MLYCCILKVIHNLSTCQTLIALITESFLSSGQLTLSTLKRHILTDSSNSVLLYSQGVSTHYIYMLDTDSTDYTKPLYW